MELPLIVSLISVCGFTGALTYNVYEFRKVGKRLEKGFKRMSEEHRKMMEEHRKTTEILERIAERLGSRA